MKLFYGEEDNTLNKGDSAYFDLSIPHRGVMGMMVNASVMTIFLLAF
jgi:hypothetical protein